MMWAKWIIFGLYVFVLVLFIINACFGKEKVKTTNTPGDKFSSFVSLLIGATLAFCAGALPWSP